MNMRVSMPVSISGQRLGETDEASLYDLLRRVGVLDAGTDRAWALALIGLALRYDPSLLVLRFVDILPSPNTPLDEHELCNALARMGLESAEVTTAPGGLDPRLGPALVLDDGPSILAVTRDAAAGVTCRVFDCRLGETRSPGDADPMLHKPVRMRVFQRLGTAGRLDRAPRTRRADHGWFMSLLVRMKGTVGLLMAMGFMLTALSLSVPVFIMLIYDQVVGQRSADPFLAIAIGGGLVIVAEVVLRVIRARALAWLAARLDYLVGTGLFEKLLGLPPRVAEQVPIASHIARIKTFESVRDFFSGPILVSALGVPATLLALVVIWALAGKLVLVAMGTILVYLLAAPPRSALRWRRSRSCPASSKTA